MTDKLQKKAKPLFDEKQKLKIRIAALFSFLDVANEIEQQKFFVDNSSVIFNVLSETFKCFLDKLEKSKEFKDRIEKALGSNSTSKDIFDYFKISIFLRKCIKYLTSKLVGRDRDVVVDILEYLLSSKNHPKYRAEGIRVLMFWMKCEQQIQPSDLHQLFSSAVSLEPFVQTGQVVNLKQQKIIYSRVGCLIHSSLNPAQESLELFQEILNEILSKETDKETSKFYYSLLTDSYFIRLYPYICNSVGILDRSSNFGFESHCPAQLQSLVVQFMASWAVADTSLPQDSLCELVFSSRVDIEIFHEILRQSFQLPFSESQTIKASLNIIRSWIMSPIDRIPDFLNNQNDFPEGDNFYIQKYIHLIQTIYDGRASHGYPQEQLDCYREGISLIRLISLEPCFPLVQDSWLRLIKALFDIAETHLTLSNKYAIISSPENAEEFADMLSETLFIMIFRAKISTEQHFQKARHILSRSTRWSHVVSHWAVMITSLTAILASVEFGIGSEEQQPELKKSKSFLVRASSNDSTAVVVQSSIENKAIRSKNYLLSKLSTFAQIHNLPWLRENVYFLWRNMLRILGDINSIERPEYHYEAISSLVKVRGILVQVREIQLFNVGNLPPLWEFAETMFAATDMPLIYNGSRAIAYGCICRMMCQKHDIEIPKEYFILFYRCILKGLEEKDERITYEILLNSKKIFSLNLPGSNILIPAFVNRICKILIDQDLSQSLNRTAIPEDIYYSSVNILSNIASLAVLYHDIQLPAFEECVASSNLDLAVSDPVRVTFREYRDKISRIFQRLLTEQNTFPEKPGSHEIHEFVICALTLLLTEELKLSENIGNVEILDESLNALVEHFFLSNLKIVNISVDCAQSISELVYMDLENNLLISHCIFIVEKLVAAILDNLHFYEAKVNREHIDHVVAKLLFSLSDWLIVLPPNTTFGNQKLRNDIFTAIESALNFEDDGGLTSMTAGKDEKGRNASLKKSVFKKETTEADDSENNNTSSTITKNAAEYCLLNILSNFQNYPTEYGPTLMNTIVPDCTVEQNGNALKMVNYSISDSVVTFCEKENNEGTRIFVRNSTGKYAIDAKIFYTAEPDENQQTVPTTDDHVLEVSPSLLINGCQIETEKYQFRHEFTELLPRNEKELPLWKPENENTDMLKDLLKYITANHPDRILYEGVQLDEKDPKLQISDDIINDQMEFIAFENSILAEKESGCAEHQVCVKPVCQKEKPPFHQSRLLANHLGWLSYSTFRDDLLHLLGRTSSFLRDIKGLDKKPDRECVKVGLIYVGPGQEDELSIIKNSTGSHLYQDFASSLGWQIDLANHPGYAGGLDKTATIEGKAVYYCTSSYEMIFHDITLFPNDDSDAKQVKKKRHVGNDQVHIVWDEHYRPYRKSTIRGDFGNAQIVISPLPNALFSVTIFRDSKVDLFGPLLDGVIVTRDLLGPLVRATALTANRYISSLIASNSRPTHLTASTINNSTNNANNNLNNLSQLSTSVTSADSTPSSSIHNNSSSILNSPTATAIPRQPLIFVHPFHTRRKDINETINNRHALTKLSFNEFAEYSIFGNEIC